MNERAGALDGWTAEKLYDLRDKLDATHRKVVQIEDDLTKIEETLTAMRSDELLGLREQVKDLQQRPQRQVAALVVPFLCACIPAAVVLLSHA